MPTPRRAATAVLLAVPLVLLSAGPGYAAPKGKGARLLDNAPPSVAITAPATGSVTGSSPTVKGTASDNRGLSLVALQVDALPWTTAVGTSTWSATLSGLTAGSHRVTAKALDLSGNIATTTTTFTVGSSTPSPSPSPSATTSPSPAPSPTTSTSPAPTPAPTPTATASPTPTTTSPTPAPSPTSTTSTGSTSTGSAPNTQGTWTSPEGAVIDVRSTGPWTIARVYQLLLDAAAGPGDFAQVAPGLRVYVQDAYASQAVAGVNSSGGVTTFSADLYLKGVSSTFASYPESQMTHEYGHVWTLRHFYLGHGSSWSDYLSTRWSSADGSLKLAQDSRVDSTYTWTTSEIIADDYRLLFGSPTAVAQMAHMNRSIVDPRQQPGLRSWFLSTWA